MSKALFVSTLIFTSTLVLAQPPSTTHVPAWSAVSLSDARAQCQEGKAVGYPIFARPDAEWLFLVVCERTGFDGEPTYGPAWTSQSFGEARKLCEAPSDSSSLAGGKAVGEAALVRVTAKEVYLVVCEQEQAR